MFGLPRFIGDGRGSFLDVAGDTTHPVYASLDHPLSGFATKRVMKKKENPSIREAERGGDERSDVGVSR